MTGAGSAPTLDGAALVVAHPDDEILWFASLVQEIGRIVIVYGDSPRVAARGAQRRRALAEHFLKNIIFLDKPQPMRAHWDAPAENENFEELRDRLNRVLQGCTSIFTHNPWGEYGHADHILVNRAVNAVASESGNPAVWVSGYVGVRALRNYKRVARDGIDSQFVRSIDPIFAKAVQSLYEKHGCWTWCRNWDWRETEHFLRLGRNGTGRRSAFNLLCFDYP